MTNIVDLEILLSVITFNLPSKADTITQGCKIESIFICINNFYWFCFIHVHEVGVTILKHHIQLTHDNFANIILLIEGRPADLGH